MYRIIAMDEKEAVFYRKVKDFLIIEMGFDPTTPIITLNSGDNGVFMRGEMAGYSLRGLKEYIAGVEGKKIKEEDDCWHG